MLIIVIRTVCILLFALTAFDTSAQGKPFKVAQGSVTGTYTKAFAEFQEYCSTPDLPLEKTDAEVSDGTSNLNALLQNQASAAFVRSDLVFFRSMSEGLSNVKTLFSLWPEQVHVLALKESKTFRQTEVPGKYFGKNTVNQQVVFNTVADLAGAKVGVAGANEITANIIRSQSGIDFQVVPMQDGKSCMAALAAGQIDAVIFTAGQPLPILKDITGATHKLLPFPDAIVEKLKGVYRPAKLYYSKVSPAAISSLEADALFVTREFKTQDKIQQLAKLRACFYTKLDQLKDEGVNPYWQKVSADNKGTWPNWYDLPTIAKKK